FTNKILKQRRQESSQKKDLLQMMLDTKNHEDGLTDFEIYDQILEKLVKEIDEALVGIGREEVPTHDKIKHLPYLNGVINEGLRLFPT
ncbi:12263_t:CDS:2, partial [Racocetra fulgida]